MEQGVDALEQLAADVAKRLDPATREATVTARLTELSSKFQREYGVHPPADMARSLSESTGAEFDDTLSADLNALKNTIDTVVVGLEKDIERAQQVPDAVTCAMRQATALSLTEQVQHRLLEQLTVQNLRADLAGLGFPQLRQRYRAALADGDMTAVRFYEAQAAEGWPLVTQRDRKGVDDQLTLQKQIAETRAARVPAALRESHARAKKLWSLHLDTGLRMFGRRNLRGVK